MEADFVIVGAGSAGCALARRLSDGGASVLLVEAGGPATHWAYRVPAALAAVLARPGALWTYGTEPEPGLGGRRLSHPRGRLVGGTSAINGMMWVRGHAADFDAWAGMGARGWDHASVLPDFRAIESLDGGADAWRGGSGPLRVRRAPGDHVLDRAFLRACAEAGHPATPDINGASQEGAGRIDQTIHAGLRVTAAAFLLGARGVRVVPGQVALGLIWEGDRAVGVRLRAGEARAGREVILAAGAFGSPHLLLLSGVGPAADLRRLGVAVVADRPGVGANLHDHPDVTIRMTCREPVSLHPVTRPLGRALAGARWILRRDGPAATSHFEVGAFLRSGAAERRPDLQMSFLPLALAPGAVQGDTSLGQHGFQVHLDLVKPRSRGRLWIASADPATPPRVLFDYLSDPSDLARLRAGVGIVRDILAQPALRRYAGQEVTPGDGWSDPEAWLRAHADTAYHPVGTCRMGDPADPLAVVDPKGRVLGTRGLRVADASVMPEIVGGNTNAASMMIGWRIGGMVLAGAGGR